MLNATKIGPIEKLKAGVYEIEITDNRFPNANSDIFFIEKTGRYWGIFDKRGRVISNGKRTVKAAQTNICALGDVTELKAYFITRNKHRNKSGPNRTSRSRTSRRSSPSSSRYIASHVERLTA